MTDFISAVSESIAKTDLITWAATVSALVYVYLALKESVWCWSFGIVSSGLSVGVYFFESLYYESLLNIFYVGLGIYGWIVWSRTKGETAALVIRKIPQRELLIVSSLAVSVGLILGAITSAKTENHFAYSDALLTSFSLVATWMTTKKYIENWIFWILIDACSAALYWIKGPTMYLFALLFVFYTIMAIAGYYSWRKNLTASRK